MNHIIERPLDEEELTEYDNYYAQGLTMLEVAEDDDPADIVEAVDSWVDNWQDERREVSDSELGPWDDNADFAIALGIVWGNQIVRQFQWSWICDISDDEAADYAVVTPDRSLIIYTTSFMKECLDNPDADCTAMLAFNMQLEDTLVKAAPKSYVNVIHRVARIIPKRSFDE